MMSQSPSVLLLIADDWSPLAACYGNQRVKTPCIDAVARDGMVFRRAYCTTPSCAASRANILTGLYSHQHGQYGHTHGVHHFRTHGAVRSIPAILNDAGVRTALIGKDHVAPRCVYPFDHYETLNPWNTSELADSARVFLSESRGKRFFLQVASMFPHRTGSDFNTGIGDGGAPDVFYPPEDVVVPDYLPDCPEVRRDLSAYYTFVSRFDHFVGSMLRVLEETGRARDTIVMILSDHGMPFPGAKASSYNTGHHCPLIIRHPDGCRGQTDACVNWTDIAPTLADIFEVDEADRPPEWAGVSFLPVLEGRNARRDGLIFFSHTFHEVTNYYPYRAVLNNRYKYVRHLAWRQPMPLGTDLFDSLSWSAVRKQAFEFMGKRRTKDVIFRPEEGLYDMWEDPMETRNLIGEPGLMETVRNLSASLTQMRVRTSDPWLEIDYQEGRLPESMCGQLSGRQWEAPLSVRDADVRRLAAPTCS